MTLYPQVARQSRVAQVGVHARSFCRVVKRLWQGVQVAMTRVVRASLQPHPLWHGLPPSCVEKAREKEREGVGQQQPSCDSAVPPQPLPSTHTQVRLETAAHTRRVAVRRRRKGGHTTQCGTVRPQLLSSTGTPPHQAAPLVTPGGGGGGGGGPSRPWGSCCGCGWLAGWPPCWPPAMGAIM